MPNRRTFLQLSLLAFPISTLAQYKTRSTTKFKSPVVVSTWDSGIRANAAGWKVLESGGSAVDAVEQAARSAEDEVSCCVGLAANPDRDGIVTLDASIMDHLSNCGGVAYVRGIKHPISVARKLMETTPHVFLAGEGATRFAVQNGFKREPELLSPDAQKAWKEWLKKSKYEPVINIENSNRSAVEVPYRFGDGSPNHDTMGTIALDRKGDLSGACTTSGMAFKMHGRVGDSPIIGAGLFVDNEVGAATSSGVGEEVIRVCGTHTVIEQMRMGRSPEQACKEAVRRIIRRNPAKAKEFQVGFIALSRKGEVGAYAIQKGFSYSVTNGVTNETFESKSFL